MKISARRISAVLVMLVTLLSVTVSAAAGAYIHDPMKNPKAAADIVEDPNAVYGYAPNPDSPRLGVYADADWSDEAFVAQMRQEREDYHESIKELYQMKADMEAAGKSVEEIARAVSTRRNEIRMEAYKDDPEGLAKLKESNLKSFGNENGGTPDYFYEKYGSWETVIEKAFSTNAGADAVLGLYDKYYDTYFIDDEADPQENTDPQDSTEAVGETVAETAAEPSTESQTSGADTSQKSPKTGDPLIVLLIIITAASGAAIYSASVLRNSQKNQ